MDSRTRDAARVAHIAGEGRVDEALTGRAGQAVLAAGTGTGTMKMAAQWTDARRAMGRLHRCGPRRPPESSANSPGASFSASDDRASRPSAGAALSRAGSVACHAAAALLVAFAAILALPLQAQAQTASNDATLSALALATASAASVALSPTFQAESTAYRAFVQNDTVAITLTATKNDDGATVMISGDTDTTTPGTASVALSEGANTITITVTAEDGLTTRTYTITVARAASAPTADPGAVWTANLTVAVNGTVVGYNKTAGTGALAPRLLMVGDSTFTVTQVEYNALSSSLPIGFEEWFILDALAYLARWGIVLHLGDVVLDFRDGFPSGFVLDWEFGDVVLLKLFTNTPDKVTGVQVTTGNKQLDVRWNKPRAAEGYKVQWKSGSQTFADAATGGREATIADEDITTYTIPNLTNGTEYMIHVIATNDVGDGDPSDVQSGIPGTTPTLSIADASAAENAGHLLFDVTLSRALRNTVKVDFETISGGTATEGVDYHARRIYTHVIPAGETTVQMGFALIEDTVDDPDETVKVRLSNARVVDAYGDNKKDLDITNAEATGTITAPSTTTTNVSGLTIGIQDATASEDSGWLVFKVRLSRKHDDYVCYDFESISGGTATEGTDYSRRPKVNHWMQIGKRVDKPFVRIIDDSENDNGETVKVKISNARLCNDASMTVSITRAEATGTITETSSSGMDSSDDGDGDDALLARVGDVTPEAATAALFGGDALTGDQLAAMDQLGNRNGAYDLGDLLSWRARCHRNEVRCGEPASATDAGSLPASPAMPPTKRNGRTPPRRRGGVRAGRGSGSNMGGSVECVPQRRAMRSGVGHVPGRRGPAVRRATGWIRALALGLVVSAWGCGIGQDVVQPAQPDPGPLHVQLMVPPQAHDIGAMLVVAGPGIDSLSAPGFELIQADEASSNRREAIIAGSLSTGPVLQVWVPDRRRLADYRVQLIQVSGDDYGLEDLAQYGIAISR